MPYMDIDATQAIDDISLDVAEENRKDSCPVGFLKLLKQKNFEEKLFPIFEGVNRVGRDVACHVTLESKTLSKEHCCIDVFCDNHFIYDLGSSNKSRRNRMVLMPNVRYELNNNDMLTLADLKLVYIKSPSLRVGDSGSDTESLPESESMLQVFSDGVGPVFPPPPADEEDDDPSSDILQPTQHAGAHLIGLHNKIDAFVEDSFQHVASEKKADLGADFVPESDSDAEAETQQFFKPTIVEYKDTDIEEVKLRAATSDMPTLAYSMDFVNETIVVEHSGNQSKSTSSPEEAVNSDADIAPTQVFDASVQKSYMNNATADVVSQLSVEKLKSNTCNRDVEDTQVVEETAIPITLGEWKATGKLDVNQEMHMYVEETQSYEDEISTVTSTPPLIDKRQLQKDKKMVRESSSSVINFSPQSASTQVFSSDAETSFIPTLVLETSDRLDADDYLVRCPERNSKEGSHTSDVLTQVFSDKDVGKVCVELTEDNLCTQIYEDMDASGSNETVAKSSTSTDDICTQVYEDRDEHHSDTGATTACTDIICSQDYNTNLTSVMSERMEPNPHTPNPSISNQHQVTPPIGAFHSDTIAAVTDIEISQRGVLIESDILQAKLIAFEPRGISSVVSESALTVADWNSDKTDEPNTETFDIPSVQHKSKGNRCEQAAKRNSENVGKTVSAEDSVEPPFSAEESGSWSAMKRRNDEKQGRGSRLSSRRTSLMQSKAVTSNPDKDTKGHSSNDSDLPCNDSKKKKRNEKSEQVISEYGNASKQSNENQINEEKIMNSEVSDNNGKFDDICSEKLEMESVSKTLGRRTSMRQNKGKRKEDNEFRKPSEEKQKNKKKNKSQAEELQPSGIESIGKICNDSEPVASKLLSEGLDSQSSRGTRSSEVVDSSQLSDDDLPSLASLIALNRIQGTATNSAVSKGLESRVATIGDFENVQPVGELESEEVKGEEIDVTKAEIMKKEARNKKCRGTESNQRTEAEMSEEDCPVEANNDPTVDEPTKKESRNKKRMSLCSKKSQRTEKSVPSEDNVMLEKNYLVEPDLTESGDKKRMRVGSKNQRSSETAKMHSEDDECVAEQKRNDSGRRGESAFERDLSKGAGNVKAGQKKNRRLAAQKQMFSDSVTEDSDEVSEKSSGHQRGKYARKPVAEKSVVDKHEVGSAVIEVSVRSAETGSSKDNSQLSSDITTVTKGNSKLSGDMEMSSGHSSRGRSKVMTDNNEVGDVILRKSHSPFSANIDANDENLIDNNTSIEMNSGRKIHSTIAADLGVVKETIKEVPKRSGFRKKSLVTEFEDVVVSTDLNKDLQPLRESETDLVELASVEETTQIGRSRKRITESGLSAVSLRKRVKNAAADGKKTEDKINSEVELLTSTKNSHIAEATDSKEVQRKRVDGTNRVRVDEVLDSHDAMKTIDTKKSGTRKSCPSLLSENDDRAIQLSGSEALLEDVDKKDERPESTLIKLKTRCGTLAAAKNVDEVERAVTVAAQPVRAETGSRRGKKTQPKAVEEELPSERLKAAQEVTSAKKNSRNLTTTVREVVSNEKPLRHVVEEVSEQRLEGTGRKRKSSALNENDNKDTATIKTVLGVDSKRLRISGKPVKDESKINEASASPHRKTAEQITIPDLAKGARRRTKSGLDPVIKPKVMFTGVVDENGQKTVKSLGGEMVESIYECTHLVTDQVRRTVKFLCGVARGLSIVSPKWLEDSRSAGRFLDPSGFLVSDVENEKRFSFSLEQTLKEAVMRPLLLGLSIHVTENVRPDPTQMKDIINCAGGKFVQELPRSFDDNVIIVTCDGKDLDSCCRLEELGIPLVSSEYIMTGILQHKLDANLFRLTTKKTRETSKSNKADTSRKKQKK